MVVGAFLKLLVYLLRHDDNYYCSISISCVAILAWITLSNIEISSVIIVVLFIFNIRSIVFARYLYSFFFCFFFSIYYSSLASMTQLSL